MGLGSANLISLAEARDKAHAARKIRHAGQNPIQIRRRAAASETGKPTFGQVADALLESKASEWRNPKHQEQWKIALSINAAPLRSRPVDEIDTAAVLAVLKPMWMEKPETASRLRGRIEAVLDAAKAQGHRTGENPAAWRGHLSHLLPKRSKLSRGHHAAMAYRDVSEFMGSLRQCEGMAATALEFAILAAARSGEVFGACWLEFDLKEKTWVIPAERMKAGREHLRPRGRNCQKAF
jgi:integrase